MVARVSLDCLGGTLLRAVCVSLRQRQAGRRAVSHLAPNTLPDGYPRHSIGVADDCQVAPDEPISERSPSGLQSVVLFKRCHDLRSAFLHGACEHGARCVHGRLLDVVSTSTFSFSAALARCGDLYVSYLTTPSSLAISRDGDIFSSVS